MLIGKPPFEAANVKLTYKKIKANDYTIPESAHLSEDAVDIIQRILAVNPSKRLSLSEIMEDRFMTKNPIPNSLPLNTLTCPPTEDFIQKYCSNSLNPQHIFGKTSASISLPS